MATFELYRSSTIGICLTEALNKMINIEPEYAKKVIVQFDKLMTEDLETRVKSKISIKVEEQMVKKVMNDLC